LHIPDQCLLQVLKVFENAHESQLKYITGNRAWNNFCVFLDQRCSRERNLRDRDLVKISRPRLHQKLRDSSILPKFCFECCDHFWVEFFLFLDFSDMFWLFLTCKCNKQKSLNFRSFTKLFLCNVQSLETCSLRDKDSQMWVSRLHHWFRHKCTLHLLQRTLVSPLHVRQWWSLEMWSWSRDFPVFESRRFEALSWSAKMWLSKTFVNQRVFGLLYLQIRNNQSR